MSRRGRSRGGGGRIRVHERTVDDETELIGGAIVLSAAHSSGIVETEQMDMAGKTRREYRNRIRRIYTWLMNSADYTSYFEQGTRVVPQAEKEDPVKFHHTKYLCNVAAALEGSDPPDSPAGYQDRVPQRIGQARGDKPRSDRAFVAVAGVDRPSLNLAAGEVLGAPRPSFSRDPDSESRDSTGAEE